MPELHAETCPLCNGFVWHRSEPCSCAKMKPHEREAALEVLKRAYPTVAYAEDALLESFLPLLRVVRAADAFVMCAAEFPDQPQACSEHLDALDKALDRCPGTRCHAMAEQSREEWKRRQAKETP